MLVFCSILLSAAYYFVVRDERCADFVCLCDNFSLIIERQPVKTYDHVEAIDETDMVRCGYPRRTRTRAWNKKGEILCFR